MTTPDATRANEPPDLSLLAPGVRFTAEFECATYTTRDDALLIYAADSSVVCASAITAIHAAPPEPEPIAVGDRVRDPHGREGLTARLRQTASGTIPVMTVLYHDETWREWCLDSLTRVAQPAEGDR